MTQVFKETGEVVPVTILLVGPCPVLQVKNVKTDGYNAVQVGFDNGKKNRLNKPTAGHLKKAHLELPQKLVREFRLADGENGLKETEKFKLGEPIKVDIFETTYKVDVTGVTKGRGFTGMVKRWNKHRGPESHGSMNVRQVGSIASDTRLTHVRPGKHMPGHYGVDTVTMRNLEVIKVDKDKNLLLVRGAVAGPTGGYVVVHKTNLVKPVPVKVTEKKKIEQRKKK